MSNRSGLPSLDELSEHIASKIVSNFHVYKDYADADDDIDVEESIISAIIRDAILEISTQEEK